ncbi:MAG: flagellar hook-basal body protein [Lachnospiraceae bacterium]|nr:flagellar hook-basal body protein [Lachnospiraceae bacterium]
MLKGLYTASTGMVNEQRRVDVLSNNMANSATTGFKKEGTTSQAFKDVLAYKIKDSSEPYFARREGVMNMGVKIGENYVDHSQGSFHETGNTFDMALSGKGFFAVEFTSKSYKNMASRSREYKDNQSETSVKYTRDGSFTLNAKGELVTKDGDYLLSKGGNHIVLDPLQKYSIDRQGNIRNTVTGAVQAQIQITDFEDYDYLERYGETMFRPVDGATEVASDAQVYSGYLEAANVQVVQEMVDLIAFTRAYESNQKIIQAYDSTLQVAVNDLGKV